MTTRQDPNPTTLDGVAARYYVKGGMGLRNGSHRDLLVQTVLSPMGRATHMPPALRASLATELLRGWVNHHDEPGPESLAWHRQLGAVQVQVGRA